MPSVSRIKLSLRRALAVGMVLIGITHFAYPEPFVKIIPAMLPAPLLLVYISGFFEIAGGIGLLVPRVQRAAAWGLVALYIAVFPANINMAANDITVVPGHPVPAMALWIRLPFQAVLIAWAWWLTRPDPAGQAAPRAP